MSSSSSPPGAPLHLDDGRPVLAHRTETGREEPLLDHLSAVARRAERYAAAFGLGPRGARAGYGHDLGKACTRFQDYIRKQATHGGNHSEAGARWAATKGAHAEAICIACHHTGLKNIGHIENRLQTRRFPEDIDEALRLATPSLPELDTCPLDGDPLTRSLLVRLLHSALIDSDWYETERWDQNGSPRPQLSSLQDLAPVFFEKQDDLEAGAKDTPINHIRAEIREACIAAADQPVGLYTAEIPTGGGKTRSLMEWALRHAQHHGQDQVIVIVPFISIIEQNAAVYREAFGRPENDAAVLEHHSMRELSHDERLTSETWDAPVVITTMVQAFESLFASRNRDLRKIHRLANSVLLIDEVQALPVGVTAPTLRALHDLADYANTSTVLSSATQIPIDEATAIIEESGRLARRMQRVTYRFDPTEHTPASLWKTHATDRTLVVCNTVADARRIADAATSSRATPEGQATDPVYHLSTAMTPEHRTRVLNAVREHLKADVPVRLVSTQLIEAGVDISFPRVIRIEGPLDGIVQAAGRCNRNGDPNGAPGTVVVTRLADSEPPPGPYKTGAHIVRDWINDGKPLKPNDPQWVRRFYEALYQQHDRDVHRVNLHLSEMAFQKAAEVYRIIDEETVTYVIHAEVPPRLLQTVRDGGLTRDRRRRLQRHAVNLYPWQQDAAKRSGHAEPLLPGSSNELMLWTGPYDAYGLRWE